MKMSCEEEEHRKEDLSKQTDRLKKNLSLKDAQRAGPLNTDDSGEMEQNLVLPL